MAVEPYLDMCSLFPSVAHGVAELFAHLNEPLIDKIGRLTSEQYYLQFVNKPLNDSDAWVWRGALSLMGVAAEWFFIRLAGVEFALVISLGMGFGLVFRGIPSRKELLNRTVT